MNEITHYVEPDHRHEGRQSIAVCGCECTEVDMADVPTCDDCQEALARWPELKFGVGETRQPIISEIAAADRREAKEAAARLNVCQGCGHLYVYDLAGRARTTVLITGHGRWHLPCWRKMRGYVEGGQ